MQAAINDAVHVWHPELVLNVGFGWGAGPEEGDLGQKLGDVMVAFVVHQPSENDVVKDGDTHTREAPGQVGVWLRNIVRATRLDWYSDVQPNPAWYPKGQITGRETTKYRAFEGDVISVGMTLCCARYTQVESQHAFDRGDAFRLSISAKMQHIRVSVSVSVQT